MNLLSFVCAFTVIHHHFSFIQGQDACASVVCPRLSGCYYPRREYVPIGQCCSRCDCSGYPGNLQHGYSSPRGADGTKKCELYSCANGKEVPVAPLTCPKVDEFKNCAKPIFNFFCGCIVQCNAGGDGPYRPTFPPIPEV